jgi:hypothetical protein
MLVPSIGLAIEPPVENGVAILCVYSGEDLATADNVIPIVAASTPFDVYFFIYNEQFASDNLGGFEFSWWLEPATPAPFILEFELPAGALNLYTQTNLVVGLGQGLPTVDNHARIVRMRLMFLSSPAPTTMFVGPATPASIPGEMGYNDNSAPGDIRVMKPNSVDGLLSNPVFGFNMPVATEPETWGSVKALFR